MNLDRLYTILNETTLEFRKGAEVIEKQSGHLRVTEVYAMPHLDDAMDILTKVDVHFFVVGVHKARAEELKAELISILDTYAEPDRLAGGPSYIEVGAAIGDQGAALRLFALGEVLGLWTVITPATFHFTGTEADKLAGGGFVMMSGYHPDKVKS